MRRLDRAAKKTKKNRNKSRDTFRMGSKGGAHVDRRGKEWHVDWFFGSLYMCSSFPLLSLEERRSKKNQKKTKKKQSMIGFFLVSVPAQILWTEPFSSTPFSKSRALWIESRALCTFSAVRLIDGGKTTCPCLSVQPEKNQKKENRNKDEWERNGRGQGREKRKGSREQESEKESDCVKGSKEKRNQKRNQIVSPLDSGEKEKRNQIVDGEQVQICGDGK
jgi:hypothetical protein